MKWRFWQRSPEVVGARSSYPLTLDQYAELLKYQSLFYQVLGGSPPGAQEEIARNFVGLVRGTFKSNSIVFTCIMVRQLLLSEARFQFRQMSNGRPGDLFGTAALAPLERPWPNATTGNLISRMEQDNSLAGNFFAVRRAGNRIKRLRPDWVDIVVAAPNGDPHDVDAEVAGYLYTPGGRGSGSQPVAYDVAEVCHYAPIPDPEAQFRGMSWITAVIQEIMGDKALTAHKTSAFERGTVPAVAMKFPAETVEQLQKWKEAAQESHPSLESMALFLGAGADVVPLGFNFEEMQVKETQGGLETRIAAASGVAPIIAGFSEGLASATYSNYGQARRRVADGTLRPLWRMSAAALGTIIDVPSGAELWYDDRDISFLQEDMKDAADIQSVEAQTIRTLVDAGFTPDSAISAVVNSDWTRLEHTDLFSVQLQPPGTVAAPVANGNGATPAAEAANGLRELEKTLS